MASSGRLPGASREYSQSSENAFRGDLQRSLSSIDSKLDAILSGRDADLSKIIHSTNYSTLPVGVSGPEEASGTVTEVTGGDGITVTDPTTTPDVSADLKANGGVVIESAELAVDLGASSITGELAVSDGGTGASTASTARGNLGFDSYLTAYRSFPAVWLTRYITGFGDTTPLVVWVEDDNVDGASGVTTWTTEESSEWADDEGDGEFEYTGSDTRMFLITWHLNMWYFLQNVYTPLMGGIFLDDGGGFDLVPGSAQLGHGYFDYALGVFSTYISGISGGSVVEVAPTNTVRFQFGFQILSGTNTGGVLHLYSSGYGDTPGMTINIVPVT